jgi:hypothetical protein
MLNAPKIRLGHRKLCRLSRRDLSTGALTSPGTNPYADG